MLRRYRETKRIADVALISLQHAPIASPALSISPLVGPLLQARWVSEEALKYSKDRKKYESNLSELRKQWAEQQKAAAAERAGAEAAAEQRRQTIKAQRARQDAASKEAAKEALLARQRADREVRAQAKAERLQHHEVRNDILEAAKEERCAYLLTNIFPLVFLT